MICNTKSFAIRFHISEEAFKAFLSYFRQNITVDLMKSGANTKNNNSIYPEVILTCDIKFIVR